MSELLDWLVGGCCGPAGRLVWTTPSPWIALAAGVAVVLLLAALRPLPRDARRVGEVLSWAVALGALVWMAAGPAWIQEGDRVEEGRRIVLVDASRSMTVREEGGSPRSDAVAPLLGRLGATEVYGFGSRLRGGAPLLYEDADSDLGGALEAVSRRYAGERLASLVVITDGVDRGGLRRRLQEDAAATLPTLGGPLTVYQVGTVGARQDLAVTDIRAGGFAFLRATFPVEVDVRAVGLARRTVPVSLTRDGQPVATLDATLDAEGSGTVRFEVRPEQVGRFLYEASVPALDGDSIPANNTLARAVRVVRDRVRILQVCGSPSWDQKFLRLFLKEDPSVDLVSFFILRTDRDMGSGYDNSELSLIGFPYERLFSTELATFDLVVFQNFDYAPYFDYGARELLANVERYVAEGGALVMIGGDRSFDLGQYGSTAIADVLPVRLGVTGTPVDEAPFAPHLTEAGARHPVTRLVASPEENAALWAALPELDGLNLTLGAAPGAAVLLEHPSLRAGGAPLPVVAVGTHGKGRSMAITADASWRWAFSEAAMGKGNQAYLRFWKNAMRWLIGDPEDQPVTVEVGQENYHRGEEAAVVVGVRDVSFAPIVGAAVDVEVTGGEGRTALQATTGADGTVRVVVPTEDRGPHRVKVTARDAGGRSLGEVQTVYAVTTRDPELDEVEPDGAFLQALAARAGGRYVAPGEWAEPLADPEAGRRVRDRTETPLGTAPLAPLLAGLAASLSWVLRRRAGLK